jgi:hypothetical protein
MTAKKPQNPTRTLKLCQDRDYAYVNLKGKKITRGRWGSLQSGNKFFISFSFCVDIVCRVANAVALGEP